MKSLILRYVLIILMCVLCENSHGQDISFKNVNSSHGLSSNLVHSACAGPDGLLWIITNYNLDSYHNGKVTNYTNAIISDIEDFEFSEILVDNENIVWLKTRTGKVFYLDKNRRLTALAVGVENGLKVLNFIKRKNGEVDILSAEGHFHFDTHQNYLDTIHLFNEPIYSKPALQINNEEEDNYLITVGGKVILYNAASGNKEFEYSGVPAYGAAMLDSYRMLVSTPNYNELFIIDTNSKKIIKNLYSDIITKYPKTNTYFRRVKTIGENKIGITSGRQGLFILDKKELSIENYSHDFSKPSSLSSDNTFMLFSNGHDVYVTTRTSGLNIFSTDRKSAVHIESFVDFKMNSIFEGHISSILKGENDHFWLSSARGLIQYNAKNKQSKFDVLKSKNGSYLNVISMFIDRKNRLWMGIAGQGLRILDSKGNLIRRIQVSKKESKGLQSNNVYSIEKGYDGSIWLGTGKGITKIDPMTFDIIPDATINKVSRLQTRIRKIKTIENETFVSLRFGGSYVISNNHLAELHDSNSKSVTGVTCFAKDTEGTLFVGSLDGVHIFTKASSHHGYNVDLKILDGRILSLDKDPNGQFWIATENQLFKYNTITKEFSSYTSDDGFTGGGFRMNGSFMGSDNMLYYGMNTGICYFDPNTIKKSAETLNPRIIGLNQGNYTLSISEDENLILPSSNNNINVHYANFNIWNDKKIVYQYSISENEPVWTNAITNPILIQNISPGKYSLRIRSSLDGKEWVDATNSILLNIKYPWWRSWWSYFIAFLIFSTTISTIVLSKIKARKAEQEKKNAELSLSNNLKKVSELEMKSLRSQMNPHFMFNSLNSINNFIVKNDQENASDYLTSFAQLMRVILENSRQDWVSLDSELKALRLYIGMEKLRFENQFIFHEIVDDSLDTMKTLVPPMLIQPYIENAIWHGLLPKKSSESNLKLHIERHDEDLIITIDDDGIGTKKSKLSKSSFNVSRKSFGQKIIKERLDLINDIYHLDAKVFIKDKSNIDPATSGTVVVLTMKIKQKK